jgi:hypothetical protein
LSIAFIVFHRDPNFVRIILGGVEQWHHRSLLVFDEGYEGFLCFCGRMGRLVVVKLGLIAFIFILGVV